MWDLFFGLVSESSTSHIGSAKIVTYEQDQKLFNKLICSWLVLEGKHKWCQKDACQLLRENVIKGTAR